jgi:hypothetical protein
VISHFKNWTIMHTDYRRPLSTFATTISAVIGLHFYRMAWITLFDFLQDAMAAVVLTHTALDNFANESMPENFSMADAAGTSVHRKQIEGYWGLPKRLTLVLPAITGKPDIETEKPGVWSTLEILKELRDDIGHVHYEQGYTAPGQDPRESVFSRLFAADLLGFITAVQETMEYYSQ